MKAKMFIAVALAGSLAFAPLVGCGAQKAADQGDAEKAERVVRADDSDEDVAVQDEQLLGGWTMNADATAALTEEQREVFDKASAGYVGAGFEPVTVLATQLVSGTNYAFLCKETTVTATPTSHWAIVVVYSDLDGNASITNVTQLDLLEYV